MSGWTYYRLHDGSDHVVGFMRRLETTYKGRPSRLQSQYCSNRCDRWQWEPIPYESKCKLAGPLPGMAYMKDPDDD